MKSKIDTMIPSLGVPKIASPLKHLCNDLRSRNFVADSERIVVDPELAGIMRETGDGSEPLTFEKAGPREKIFFDPSKLRCALVTCGGLCPGLNDIIRSIVMELHYAYGVKRIYGIKHGLQGFIPDYGHDMPELDPDGVRDILEHGGSILGTSRGPQDVEKIVDCLDRKNIEILFMIGGDGTLRASSKIADEITGRKLNISVIGIPKTIDNDIYMVAKSFGFDTAVDVATNAVKCAHNEARGYINGVGVIKLMGRHSGFIAATAALARQDVNFVLIPESDFDMEALLEALEKRLALRRHAVIVVAEGAGQKFFDSGKEKLDASGNVLLNDIGIFLKARIAEHFNKKQIDISIKYIDPSYMIRGVPAIPNDRVFCSFLGRDAVHAGMAGKTKMIVGYWNDRFVHIPMKLSTGRRKQVDVNGRLWMSVLESTGQGTLVNGGVNSGCV